MKLVKLSVFALTMGLFLASCGGAKTEEAKTDSAMATTAPVEAAPAPAADTTAKPAADTAKPAAAATEVKKEEPKKAETKTDAKKK